MSPAERAAQLCRARGETFRDEVEAHLLNGYVFSTPDLFCLARAMPRSTDADDLWTSHPIAECDAWFVWIGVGDPFRLLALMPFALPWTGWHRQGRDWQDVHWVPTALLHKKLSGFKSALAIPS